MHTYFDRIRRINQTFDRQILTGNQANFILNNKRVVYECDEQ
jgi:hypothetical protein